MNAEEIEHEIKLAIESGFREKLFAKGQARSILWKNGRLPEGSPHFPRNLTYDLLTYGTALLSLAISLKEMKGNKDLIHKAFNRAGEAIESAVSKGDPENRNRGFWRIIAATAFHLGGYSARAFSLLEDHLNNSNLSQIERVLALLILRSLHMLESEISTWRLERHVTEKRMMELINSEFSNSVGQEFETETNDTLDTVINFALTDTYFSGIGCFLSALHFGNREYVTIARQFLNKGLKSSGELNFVPQWWSFWLTCHLIDDLWSSSFFEILPPKLPSGSTDNWENLRNGFTASLHCRDRSEIDLWPSQIDAAKRSTIVSDNLVVSLPTSAGKTRIAELCILRCLADKKRVVFVTPLRALCAQTEASLQRTFGPLGIQISTLYGSIGFNNLEAESLRKRDIVVSTPEKLDFALRNDPNLLNNVGLIVLDEGHMIGIEERNVRYEAQIQRLIKREDADERRIVCLSAILPDGEQFDDFVKWLRRDKVGNAISLNWKPTRTRFGEVTWKNNYARLDFRNEGEPAFVAKFIEIESRVIDNEEKKFPSNQKELVIATAWRLIEEGQSILIYCPQKNIVDTFASDIVKLSQNGFIGSVLTTDRQELETALSIGTEYLGVDSPILKCLELGVAIHHGALPTPFRREIERLLREKILKITVSSPTLSQGLNLAATAVIFHDIGHFRNQKWKPMEMSEFLNVIGRAGRAYIDVEGHILFPIFKEPFYVKIGNEWQIVNKRNEWYKLIDSTADREMTSGLVLLVKSLLSRMNKIYSKTEFASLQEYVINSANAWNFSKLEDENEKQQAKAKTNWNSQLALLDTAILSLLGEKELAIDEVTKQLDEILSSSLWQRTLRRKKSGLYELYNSSLLSRAKVIWRNSTAAQRRGYFLAGVGLNTGKELDKIAPTANKLLVEANGALLFPEFNEDQNEFITKMLELAVILFKIHPFTPKFLPKNWKKILEIWLQGEPVSQNESIVKESTLRFIEEGIIYKLTWGIEAIRVRAQANRDNIGNESMHLTVDDVNVDVATSAIETGTKNLSAAILMKAGFTSRSGSIKAVEDTQAKITDYYELSEWLDSDKVKLFSEDKNWPTTSSRKLWEEFRKYFKLPEDQIWSLKTGTLLVNWSDKNNIPTPGTQLMLHVFENGPSVVMTVEFNILGQLKTSLSTPPVGMIKLKMGEHNESVSYEYFGPENTIE